MTEHVQIDQETLLTAFVKRRMSELNIRSGRELAKRSSLDQSYISRILKGEQTNLSNEATVDLARGLRVSPVLLFQLAIGISFETATQIASNPEAAKLFEIYMLLNPERQKLAMKLFQGLAEPEEA